MIITLPWPDIRLNPNARVHWRPLAIVKAEAKVAAFWQTKASMPMADRARVIEGKGRIPMTITFYPPDARHRDDDNAIASFKAARDGIAAALGCDDRRFRPHYIFADPCKPGRVEVAFTGVTLSPTLSDFTHENSAPYASGVLNESGPQQRDNAATGLTTNAKELRDGS